MIVQQLGIIITRTPKLRHVLQIAHLTLLIVLINNVMLNVQILIITKLMIKHVTIVMMIVILVLDHQKVNVHISFVVSHNLINYLHVQKHVLETIQMTVMVNVLCVVMVCKILMKNAMMETMILTMVVTNTVNQNLAIYALVEFVHVIPVINQ